MRQRVNKLIQEMTLAFMGGKEKIAAEKARELLKINPNFEMAIMVLDFCGELK
ncbi:hypothetical protein LCGC14_0580000 [marine sediment metagenome]|uniref:Tetratricopeptide repeat protein n=1 Tax=marine sediment metagenome TaxID=412755 RepID=A0A0F9UQ10_9ZZZZ